MENRFNLLTSKEWLPFQKSWSIPESDSHLYRENLRFFTLPTMEPSVVYYYGPDIENFRSAAESVGIRVTDQTGEPMQFGMIDLRSEIRTAAKRDELVKLSTRVESLIAATKRHLVNRRFLCVLAENVELNGALVPVAWDIGKLLANHLSLKDEKILCSERHSTNKLSGSKVEYALYARSDDAERHSTEPAWQLGDFLNRTAKPSRSVEIPKWFVLKPPPRKKGEVLHPAKYPESLAESFIRTYSEVGSNVIDPMSGTGSTQLAAVSAGRNGYGTELSPFFAELAINRLHEFCDPAQAALFPSESTNGTFRIVNADARDIPNLSFPSIAYACTSPPYWDMLNMKGAENQARRIEQGLQTNYSADDADLGNIADYSRFLDELTDVYVNMFKVMEPESYFTFIVKNIKKQGAAYPFAWDLTHRLLPYATPIAEHFWLQDDLSIAPYGYGNTWVSNTFHQYCVTVQLTT